MGKYNNSIKKKRFKNSKQFCFFFLFYVNTENIIEIFH